ncbi:MAG: hypothetical protein FIA94_07785 [Nitrospirae bacterium]|nr:hypothetical protein [Nitrospirota bacterium]
MTDERGRDYFDRAQLRMQSLCARVHDLDIASIKPLHPVAVRREELKEVARSIRDARERGSAVILMAGGHVIRAGVQRYLIDLLEKGYITCMAMNGAVMVHDFEFSLVGATTESVAHYIRDGQFGLWKETSCINDIVNRAYREGGIGMGHAVGRAIAEGSYPHKDISVLAACYRLGIPATVHVGIGYDIIHEHPNFDGAAAGALSYLDFLSFTRIVEHLEGGVLMNFGSAVMAPEIYLKALSMARNVAAARGDEIRHFATLVCDLYELPSDFRSEPDKKCAGYYFRPWKTMLVRTVADGGRSYYVRGDHADTVPELWTALRELATESK